MNLFELAVKIEADTTQAKKSISEYKKDVMNLAQTYKKQGMDMSSAMKKAYSEIDKSQYETAEKSKNDSKKFSDNWVDAGEKVSGIAKKIGNGLKTAAKIGTAAVGAVGSGISALGAYTAKVGGDFEAQMSKVSAISGATGDDLQALEDKAKQLGIDTKFSATEAGQAFEYMAMAGWKTEQMLNGVAGIMDLAAASGEDLASVSDIVTDAMTAFGLSADQSTHFADVLAKASSNANTNVGLMGETFKYVAPVAGAMGYSIEDTAVAIGLMANAGIKGSQAGTALRGMLARLAKPTDEVSWAMDQLGLSLSNADGTMKDFDELLLDLREGFADLGEAERTEMAALLAGQEAMSGLLSIVSASDADFNKLTESINNADGASKQMANTMANNLQGQFTLLKSSAEGFGLALYDKIQQPLTDMVSWAVDGLNQLTKAFNENGVDGLVEAAGNILSEAIDEIVNGLPKIVDLSMRVIDSFVGGINKNLDSVVGGAVSVVETLATGILNMLPKIVKLGLDLIVSLASGIAESLPTLIPTIIGVILKIVETLTSPQQLKNLLDAAFTLGVELAFGLMDAIPQLVNAINQIVMNIGEFLTKPENIAMILEAALQIIIALGTGVLNAVPVFLKNMVTFYGKIFDNFKNTNWGELGKNLVDGLLAGLKRAWASITGWFANAWDNLFGGVGDFLGGIFGGGNSKISIDGSHRNGLDYVPYDGYIAELHKGERVLTASEARGYGGTSIGNININIDGAKYTDEQSLASAIALEIQNMTDRRAAVYA